MRLLFIGDVVSKRGVGCLCDWLLDIKRKNSIDITVINGENSATGNGVTAESADSLTRIGADVITTGNHAFRRSGCSVIYEENQHIIRPANYPAGAPGRGVCVLDMGRCQIAVINLMGVVYMEPLDNPFSCIDDILKDIKTPNIFVDFHAEASAEKKAMGYYLDGRVTAVIGTHTHVQTADEQLLPEKTAYITDAGFTGPEHSVLGVKKELSIQRQRFHLPVRFEEAEGSCCINGVIVDFDEKTGRANGIRRLNIKNLK